MSALNRTFENVRANILSCHMSSTSREKVNFYNSFAETYDTDVAVLDYRAPSLAANMISSHFKGDREAAVVLDVACGTGLVAKQLTTHGFRNFVGNDGSEGMLEVGKKSGLYQELKQCLLGEDPLPVQWGLFDVVVIVGALSAGQVPVNVVRELCKSAKPVLWCEDDVECNDCVSCSVISRLYTIHYVQVVRTHTSCGYICMTTRGNCDNAEYKAALERELKQMEDEGLWTCVEVAEVKDWERAVSEQEHGYIPGAIYLYKKL